MTEILILVLLPLAIFSITFPALWIGVNALLSSVGGWSLLAGRFTASERENGEEFRFASALFNKGILPVTYRGCLTIIIGEKGVYFSLLFLFRFHSPALFIPWKEIESTAEQRHLFGSYGVMRIRSCPVKILISGTPGKKLLEASARIIGRNIPVAG
jgi:hypothetical protein